MSTFCNNIHFPIVYRLQSYGPTMAYKDFQKIAGNNGNASF